MKKSLLAMAALTAFAGAASAQSSVTIFGVIDAAARSVKNGAAGELKTLSTDGMGSSRLGFRGVEDLGGGLRASFWLEGSVNVDVGGGQKAATPYVSPAGSTTGVGINPNTGTAANGNFYTGQDWQRRATVSLSGGFGEIRLGRDYTPDFWNMTVFDPFGTNGVGSSTNVYTPVGYSAGTTVRANNTIGYFLPAMGGLYGQVQVAAGERAVGNKHMAARIGYAAGPVNVAVAYGKTDIDVAQTQDYERIDVGASFNLGFMTLMGQYIHGEGSNVNTREITNYLIGGIIPIGAGNIKFSYIKSDGDGPTAANRAFDATQIAVGYQYSLSKRTAIYAHAAQIDNKSGAAYTASTGGPVPISTGFKSRGYEFGINHSF